MPSPVTATTSPRCCRRFTKRALSSGRAREITRRWGIRSNSSASFIAANSAPVMWLISLQLSSQSLIWRAISLAVPGVSPVTIFTCMPACIHSSIAAGTSARTGSAIAVMPINCNPLITNFPFSEITVLGSSITL